jgi:hypothetical protein
MKYVTIKKLILVLPMAITSMGLSATDFSNEDTVFGRYYLLADRGDMVFYVEVATLYAVAAAKVRGRYITQHSPSTDDTRSMVTWIEVDCEERTIAKSRVDHWSGDWGNGKLVSSRWLGGEPRAVESNSLRDDIVSFFCGYLQTAAIRQEPANA